MISACRNAFRAVWLVAWCSPLRSPPSKVCRMFQSTPSRKRTHPPMKFLSCESSNGQTATLHNFKARSYPNEAPLLNVSPRSMETWQGQSSAARRVPPKLILRHCGWSASSTNHSTHHYPQIWCSRGGCGSRCTSGDDSSRLAASLHTSAGLAFGALGSLISRLLPVAHVTESTLPFGELLRERLGVRDSRRGCLPHCSLPVQSRPSGPL